MPCYSAARRNNDPNFNSCGRAKTALTKGSQEYNRRLQQKGIKEKCESLGKKNLDRVGIPNEYNFNDMLSVTAFSSPTCSKARSDAKIKIYPTVIPKRELQRLKHASKIISLEERVEELNRMDEEAKQIQEESNKRKQMLKEIDDARMKAKLDRDKAKGTTKKDDESDDERTKILDRAFIAKHEQEEEVRKATRVILNTKCHVIRDAQIQEKAELIKEIKDEDYRLDKLMLEDAQKSLHKDDEKTEFLKQVRLRYADGIRKQLDEREHLRLLEAQRIEEEAKRSAQANAVMKRDEELKAKIRHENREKLRTDLDKGTAMSALYKRMLFEQDKAAEMQVQAYMREKEERERKLAIERRLAKETRERTQQRLYDKQKKMLELKSEQGELALRRDQEEKEKQFRKNEKEKALHRKRNELELVQSRENQLNEMKNRQALQMARNENDFMLTVKKLSEDEQKTKKDDLTRLQRREKYREEIIRQMNEKEMERREQDNRAKNEFLALKEKEEVREKNIRSVIQTKINAMKEANVPEKYVKDVEKQLKLTF